VTRSLGAQSVPLITAVESSTALAGCSRHSQMYFSYPSPLLTPELFTLAITELCKQQNIDIVMPMTELTAALLLNAQADATSNLSDITLPFADLNTVDSIADKCSLMQLAEDLDISIPGTWYATDPDNLPVDLARMSYPLVLKPGKSWVPYQGEWIHTSVKIADNATQAADILKSDRSFQAHPFMLQEYIPGSGEGVFALYDHGKPLAFFAHKRLREKPPRGGVSVLSESAAVDPVLESYARKLLDHVGWHGVAMVEFRVTPDGAPYLMEINTRFWGSLQLAVDAGVDFPWLLYQVASGMEPEPRKDYKKGIRLRWLLGDIDSLYLTLRDSELSAIQKLKSILKFLTPHPFITRHEVNRWCDIKPFWWELKQYLKDLLGRD
ncbi:MAG: ATP-grasp domain-containing protein, partial [Gammaproteobacteria bacterium]|nr:ATP-grasp domain-containing protein [Gammaproteobacteria bacterium]